MSVPVFPIVPAGRVHCRVAGVEADGADVDLHPDWTAKAGQAVTIKPLLSPGLVFTGPDEPILVDLATVQGVVNADGYIVNASTLAPVYLVATDAVGLSVTGWLWEAEFPFSPLPTVRFAVPAGGVAELTDFVLAPAVDATRTWVEQIPELIELLSGGAGGGVTDHGALTGLADDDHPQYHNNARGDARYSLTGHNHAGTYAPALGPDDNYVTDAEKAALHTHPAVIAQGATAAAARAAIGAGTSSFSGAYADLSGKPTIPDTEAIQDVVGGLVVAAGGTYDDGAGTITLPAGGAASPQGLILPPTGMDVTWTSPVEVWRDSINAPDSGNMIVTYFIPAQDMEVTHIGRPNGHAWPSGATFIKHAIYGGGSQTASTLELLAATANMAPGLWTAYDQAGEAALTTPLTLNAGELYGVTTLVLCTGAAGAAFGGYRYILQAFGTGSRQYNGLSDLPANLVGGAGVVAKDFLYYFRRAI